MRPVKLDEILPFEQYERMRARLRPVFIAEKARRRLALGSHLTLLFENGQTVWYQVQEMVRTERMTASEAIQHELDTYNELMPAAGELAATLLIEYEDPRERDVALRRLVGLEKHLWLEVGGERRPARFDDRQMSLERISAVQFVRLPVKLEAGEFRALAAQGKIAVEADHPSLAARAPIDGPLAAALAADLQTD